MFTKGDPNIWKKGRPKGAKDKKLTKLAYWVTELDKVWGNLSHIQKAKISVEMIKIIVAKTKAPLDAEDSVKAVNDMLSAFSNDKQLLDSLEEETNNGNVTGAKESSDNTSLEHGQSNLP